MDRPRTVAITHDFLHGSVKIEDIIDTIAHYCTEKGKDKELSTIFATKAAFDLSGMFFKIALEYFQRKYELVIIRDKDDSYLFTY